MTAGTPNIVQHMRTVPPLYMDNQKLHQIVLIVSLFGLLTCNLLITSFIIFCEVNFKANLCAK